MLFNEAEERKVRLAAIIDSSEDAIISKDLNGIIASWNRAAEQMFGYAEAEVIGRHISILIPKDRLEEEQMIISKLKKGERIEHYETIRKTKSGNKIFISLSISPIMDSSGIIGASKIARDITKQKETEATLQNYADQLEAINTVSRSLITSLDEKNILQTVTDATTKLSGAAFGAFFYNTVDAKGESFMLYTISGASRDAFDKFGMPRNTDVFGTTFDGLGILRSDDITKDPRYGNNKPHHGMPKGHLPVVSYLAVPVISQSGVVIGGLFYGHPEPGIFKAEHEDIISAIAVQAAIVLDNAKLYDNIKTLNNKKDEFIGYASHELKTPLTTMSGYLQIAESSPELLKEFVPKIRKQITKLTAIISDLLDISKIEASKLNLKFTQVGLQAFIKEITESVNQVSGTHTVQCELPSDEELILIDTQKMGQVLTNLLNNAVKYSPGENKVLLTAVRRGDLMQLSIRDWGIGIATSELDKIFNRFYRSSGSRGKADGLGVALYIAQEIVEAHRGRIWVESEEGKGSVFHISFPFGNSRMNK